MKSKVLEEEKAREQDRIGEAEKKIGGLEAKFNDMMGKLAVFDNRMTKMEEIPDVKQASQLEDKKELSSADTFEGVSPRDSQYWRKTNAIIEKIAEEKQ